MVIKWISPNLPEIKSIYVKGSYVNDSFHAGESDIDLIVILDDLSKKSKFEIRIKFLKKFFPMLGDVDFFTINQLETVIRFGSHKFHSPHKWLLIYGKPTIKNDWSYLYYPLKFSFEQIHELYFYLEWLIKNVSSKQTKYRKRIIKRTIVKIVKTLTWIESPTEFVNNTACDLEVVEKISRALINEASYVELSNYLNSSLGLSKINNALAPEFSWYEKNYTVSIVNGDKKISFGDNFSFICAEAQISSQRKDLILMPHVYDLFIKAGCYNLGTLKNFVENTSSKLCANMIKLYLAALSIERKLMLPLVSLDEISEIKKTIIDTLPNSKRPLSIIDKTIMVSVNWGHDPVRLKVFQEAVKQFKRQSVKLDWFFIDLTFQNRNDFSDICVNHLAFQGKESQSKLWQKEALFNVAINYLYGAHSYILLDADVYPIEDDWALQMEKKLKSNQWDFVHGFSQVQDTLDKNYVFTSWTKSYLSNFVNYGAPGLIWGITRKFYNDIRHLPDIFPDGSNDGALMQEITGHPMGMMSNLAWYQGRIRHFSKSFKITYLNQPVMHINHGKPRDYHNRAYLLDLLNKDFEQLYSKNEIGVWTWVDNLIPQIILNLHKNIEDSMLVEFVDVVDDLINRNVLKVPKQMKFRSPSGRYEMEIKNGLAFLIELDENSFRIITSKFNDIHSSINIRLNHENFFNGEHSYVEYEVNKPIFSTVDIISCLDWWRLAGAKNIYDRKYFKNSNKQKIGIVTASWQDHSNIFNLISLQYLGKGDFVFQQKIKEHINFFHKWDYVFDQEYSIEDLLINKKSIILELDKIIATRLGWFRIDVAFAKKRDEQFRITILQGALQMACTTTHKSNEINDETKILFYKTSFMDAICLKLIYGKASLLPRKIRIKISERAKI
jgi:predicted nucleotidyltransferase